MKRDTIRNLPKLPAFVKSELAIAFMVMLVSLASFVQTQAREQTGIADSDEVAGMALTGGYLHPPGYPVFINLLTVFLQLPMGGGVIARGHLFNAFLAALALGGLYLTTRLMLQALAADRGVLWRQRLAGVVAVLGLAWSFEYWFWAGVVEVFAFHLLLVSLFMGSVLAGSRSSDWRWYGVGAVVFGLGLSHHQTFVLLLPALIPFVRQANWRKSLVRLGIVGLVATLTFGLAYASLAWRDGHAAWTWVAPTGLVSLGRYIMRSDFSGVAVEGEVLSSYLSLVSLAGMLHNLEHYVTVVVPGSFHAWFLMAFLTGLFVLVVKRGLKEAQFVLLVFVLIGLGIAAYVAVPAEYESLAYFQSMTLAKRLYLAGYLPMAVVTAVGLEWWIARIQEKQGLSKKAAWIMSWGIAVGLLSWSYASHLTNVSLAEYNEVATWAKEILSNNNESRIVCFSDISCFSLLYRAVIDGEFEGEFVPIAPQITGDELVYESKTYMDNPYRVGEAIFAAITRNEPVVVAEVSPVYTSLLGFDRRLLTMSPQGFVQALACTESEQVSLKHVALSQRWAKSHWDERASGVQLFRKMLALTHAINAQLYAQRGERVNAAAEVDAGLLLAPKDTLLRAIGEEVLYQPTAIQREANTCRDAVFWLELSRECGEYFKPDCELQYAYWATLVEPESVEARLVYAQVLEAQGYLALAGREYAIVNELAPGNRDIEAQLERLRPYELD